jgi:hypothetical protein
MKHLKRIFLMLVLSKNMPSPPKQVVSAIIRNWQIKKLIILQSPPEPVNILGDFWSSATTTGPLPTAI